MKKDLILITIILCIIGVSGLNLFMVNLHNSRMSNLLIIAIENSNDDEAKKIIEKEPGCIESLPTLAPKWLQIIVEMPEISYPLQTACGMGRFEIVKLLLEKGADCNLVYKGIWGSKSCLSYAVLSGAEESEQIIQLLLQNGADKDYVDECGKKAYDYAAESDNVELQELLR